MLTWLMHRTSKFLSWTLLAHLFPWSSSKRRKFKILRTLKSGRELQWHRQVCLEVKQIHLLFFKNSPAWSFKRPHMQRKMLKKWIIQGWCEKNFFYVSKLLNYHIDTHMYSASLGVSYRDIPIRTQSPRPIELTTSSPTVNKQKWAVTMLLKKA